MESIEQMIERLCPEGVKYKKLGDVCEIRRGIRVVKKQLGDSVGFPVYQNSLTSLGMYQSSNRKPNTTFVICAGAAGEIGFCDGEFWAADDCSTVESDVLTDKFIYYFLMTQQNKLKSQVRKASVPRLSRDAIENLSIPLPPLEIQTRIVEVLDKMTSLTAELEAELDARKQQYEYYRNKLLIFNEIGGTKQVTWKKISKMCVNCDNKRKPITSGKRIAGEYPYYGASGIVDYVEGYIFDGDYLLVSEDGANLLARNTPIAFSISGKNWVNNHAHVLQFDTYTERKFVEYYLNMIDLSKYISGGAQAKLTQQSLNEIPIPVPSMEEQERIVSILDRFEALTTDLQSGLPAEIEARRQQYEYYRNKLLTFDKIA